MEAGRCPALFVLIRELSGGGPAEGFLLEDHTVEKLQDDLCSHGRSG